MCPSQLDISVSAEGAQSPLGDMSQVLLEKIRIKDLGIRAEGLATRLKELTEKSVSSFSVFVSICERYHCRDGFISIFCFVFVNVYPREVVKVV